MEFKFEIGQRVAIRDGHFGYLKGGQTGVIKKGIVLNGLPEYLVFIDDGGHSDVTAWFLREQDLVAVEDAELQEQLDRLAAIEEEGNE